MGFWFDDSERQIIAQEQTTAAIKAQTEAIEYAADVARREASRREGYQRMMDMRAESERYHEPTDLSEIAPVLGGIFFCCAVIGFIIVIMKAFTYLMEV